MGDFNVFDEWGNYAGKFTPAGGGLEGCFFTLALITVGIVIFVFYILIKLVVMGLAALFNGDISTAIKYLAIPTLVMAMFVCQIAAVGATQLVRENRQQEVLQEAQWALANPDQAFTIERTGSMTWTIKNNLHQTVGAGSSDAYDCTSTYNPSLNHTGAYYALLLGPGQTTTLTCTFSPVQIQLWSDESSWTKVGKYCLEEPDFKCKD